MIEPLGFAGYFLVVWEIVQFCKRDGHPLPGAGQRGEQRGVLRARHHQRRRGATSACCSSGSCRPSGTARRTSTSTSRATAARRSSSTSTQRYGRHHTAQVANVITYRAKSAVRDMAKALGFAPGQQDAWSKQVDAWGDLSSPANQPVGTAATRSPTHVIDLASEIEDAPRHLGIHSGGMVICDRPVVEVCPVEWARMDEPQRAAVGQGRLRGRRAGQVRPARPGHARPPCTCCIDLVREHRGYEVDLATPAPGRRGLRDAVPGRHRRRVPGREPGADGHAAAAAGRGSSTTSSSRSR